MTTEEKDFIADVVKQHLRMICSLLKESIDHERRNFLLKRKRLCQSVLDQLGVKDAETLCPQEPLQVVSK